jgi:hypothetical protein
MTELLTAVPGIIEKIRTPLRCDGKIRPGARVNLVNDVEVDDVIGLMTTLQNLGDQPVRFFLGDADDDGVIDDGVTCTYG